MKIENIKQLQQLIKLLRKSGVSSVRVDGIEMHFHDSALVLPEPTAKKSVLSNFQETYVPGGVTADTAITTPDMLTEEQLLFYSSDPVTSYSDIPIPGGD